MQNANTINAIIVDDERKSIVNLQHYLSRFCTEIAVIGTGSTLTEVLTKTDNKKIDVAFLDIELLDGNIFGELTNNQPYDFKIVFVTAYQQDAIKGIKIEALAYILKPLGEEDIKDAYQKIKKHFLPSAAKDAPQPIETETDTRKKIILKGAAEIYVVKAEDILYMEGSGFYTKIFFLFHAEIKSVTLSKPLNKLETEYYHTFFFRVHKSYIINVLQIQAVQKNATLAVKMKDNLVIAVAKRRANEFLAFLNNHS